MVVQGFGFGIIEKIGDDIVQRVDSSMMMAGRRFRGSLGAVFFCSSSAELLMIPRGLRISWETPATISPRDDKVLGAAELFFELELLLGPFLNDAFASFDHEDHDQKQNQHDSR
jgi:hypothetical protein